MFICPLHTAVTLELKAHTRHFITRSHRREIMDRRSGLQAGEEAQAQDSGCQFPLELKKTIAGNMFRFNHLQRQKAV